jgi:hypothetical protein
MTEGKDLMRMVCDTRISNTKPSLYTVDIPCGMKHSRMTSFWNAIETIKGGHAYDDRYSWKEASFDSPAIWVFCNEAPDIKARKRIGVWKLWEVNSNQELIPLDPEDFLDDI